MTFYVAVPYTLLFNLKNQTKCERGFFNEHLRLFINFEKEKLDHLQDWLNFLEILSTYRILTQVNHYSRKITLIIKDPWMGIPQILLGYRTSAKSKSMPCIHFFRVSQKILDFHSLLVFVLRSYWSCLLIIITPRVEVWRWIFIRNAVKCGEKKIIFTTYFLYIFAVNAVNRGELFIFTAFSFFLRKRIVPTRVGTSDLPNAFNCLVHCANSHLHL